MKSVDKGNGESRWRDGLERIQEPLQQGRQTTEEREREERYRGENNKPQFIYKWSENEGRIGNPGQCFVSYGVGFID